MRGSPEGAPEATSSCGGLGSADTITAATIRNSGTIDVVDAYTTADFIVGRDNPNTKSGTLITFA